MLRPFLIRALAVLATLPTLDRAARAESPPSPCYRRPEIRPGLGGFPGSLPVNAPALVFLPPMGWDMRPIADYEIELRDRDQNVVPATLEAEGTNYLVRLSRMLRGAELSIRFRDFCSYATVPSLTGATVPLAAASPLPTTAGTAMLRENFVRYSGGGQAPCLPAAVYMVVDVRMSPELQAYRAVSRWDITYKGKTRRVEYGEMQTGGELAYVALEETCDVDTESVGGPVTIAVHVAGASSDPPPLQLTVSARCPDHRSPKAPPACVDGGAPELQSPMDAGALLPDAAALPPDTGSSSDVAQLPPDAGATGHDASDNPPSRGDDRSGGCHIGATGGDRRQPGAPTAWLLVSALAALGRRRRALPGGGAGRPADHQL